MHGGVKVYRGSAAAARNYVEADRSRVDDYYLAEGTGLAERLVALNATLSAAHGANDAPAAAVVIAGGTLDGDAYEGWVAGLNDLGAPKGRIRHDDKAVRFVEVVVNGPKTWSLAAVMHPDIAAAYDAAQGRAATQIIGWVAANATTRVGPRGRQVQVPVEQLEAAVIRHHTSRAGDPHRHLHLQVNARVFAAGKWRGIHTVGIRDSLDAINGIGHAAVMCDPEFRSVVAAHGYSFDTAAGEIEQFAPYVAEFSERAAQIERNTARYEARWRADNPGAEPGPGLRRSWDSRAWAQARPDKVVPADGAAMVRHWRDDLYEAGFRPPPPPLSQTPASGPAERGVAPAQPSSPAFLSRTRSLTARRWGLGPRVEASSHNGSAAAAAPDPVGSLDRDQVVATALIRLGTRRSSWNAADIRGEVERAIAAVGVIAPPEVRAGLAEDLTTRAVKECVPLLERPDVPGHVRAMTSPRVLAVEADLTTRFAARAEDPDRHGKQRLDRRPDWARKPTEVPDSARRRHVPPRSIAGSHPGLDPVQRRVVDALAGTDRLVVVEGAAGAGKTTTLASARAVLEAQGHRLMVVTPTRKAARVASRELASPASSAARLAHQYGFRWDDDGRWSRYADAVGRPSRTASADLHPGDVLLVDEAGMLDQDTASALTRVADETGARLVLMGDRHQLPAVGRGGVLDLAARWAAPDAVLTLDTVHRFTDRDYAPLTLLMRTGERSGDVFDQLWARGQIRVHPSDVERTEALTTTLTTRLTTTERAHAAGTPAELIEAGGTFAGTAGGTLLIAKTRAEVDLLNQMVRDHRVATGEVNDAACVHSLNGGRIGAGDTVATRLNDHQLDVANRDTWTVAAVADDGSVTLTGRGDRTGATRAVPAAYARRHLSLAYATTAHGSQGDTVDTAHLLLSEHTDAASTYVAMTRGRETNTAHLVADTVADARRQWIEVFSRDRADLGPAHATYTAAADIERYGPAAPTLRRPGTTEETQDHQAAALARLARSMTADYLDEPTQTAGPRRHPPHPGGPAADRRGGIGR